MAETQQRPQKRAKLLDLNDSDEEEDARKTVSFKVNEKYAARFEHNKKRVEKQRLEEKYGKGDLETSESESDSDDETEDDEGMAATVKRDAEISNLLNAIRSKDPSLYDEGRKWYEEEGNPDEANGTEAKLKEKSMSLKEYHRKNLLGGAQKDDDDTEPQIQTYDEEQQELKDDLIRGFKDAGNQEDSDSDDGFLKQKEVIKAVDSAPKITADDIEKADEDPEAFMSKYLSARAWVPTDKARFQPLESDDEEDDVRADEVEHAWNMRFEDPETANEKLRTHSRTVTAEMSVRREKLSSRRRAREAEKERKEADKQEREADKARLRKLKIDEMEEKVEKIREVAGLSGKEFHIEEWARILEADWDDDKWEKQMAKHFGSEYYDEREDRAEDFLDGGISGNDKKHRKLKKPKWDDDIDVGDLVPDFDANPAEAARIALSDEDETRPESSKDTNLKEAKKEKKHQARVERRKIEALVDANLDIDMLDNSAEVGTSSKSKGTGFFRYRETSPTAFGLSPLDILTASDAQLNTYAGLKKLAAFRDPKKKRKDKKALNNWALRNWRKETFGTDDAPTAERFQELLRGEQIGRAEEKGSKSKKRSRPAETESKVESKADDKGGNEQSNVVDGERKKKRRKQKKSKLEGVSLDT
ncbi:hypothetical protein P152DRAFT_408606 [Eremomyces bilateralis CBS 781.70]|uniref:Kri1-like C-terminal domain-containing protein n=1 Tax=Eremomyces bilateralis CBS 781.70 TaxID=1392243 RepID=A0A6G1GDX2_9PEZI|nr:uncharacterized protein P152DRAFT_408606 [Eremomyces bilateralis CBS 781.70]KAF1816059.1 hypothetical protein P152DRAFT_408606 [Eremomyces bilateralis CBS 781.70]